MGYQVTYMPSKEKMEEYKQPKDYCSWVNVTNIKNEILSHCMKDNDKTAYECSLFLKINLGSFYDILVINEKKHLYDRWLNNEEGEVWFCGWELLHELPFDRDSLIENYIDKLFVLDNIVDTPSYFTDTDEFYKKLNDVKRILDEFESDAYDTIQREIMEDLREFEVNKKEDDEA